MRYSLDLWTRLPFWANGRSPRTGDEMAIPVRASRASMSRYGWKLWDSLKFLGILLAYLPLLPLSLVLIFLLVGFELFDRDESHPRKQKR